MALTVHTCGAPLNGAAARALTAASDPAAGRLVIRPLRTSGVTLNAVPELLLRELGRPPVTRHLGPNERLDNAVDWMRGYRIRRIGVLRSDLLDEAQREQIRQAAALVDAQLWLAGVPAQADARYWASAQRFVTAFSSDSLPARRPPRADCSTPDDVTAWLSRRAHVRNRSYASHAALATQAILCNAATLDQAHEGIDALQTYLRRDGRLDLDRPAVTDVIEAVAWRWQPDVWRRIASAWRIDVASIAILLCLGLSQSEVGHLTVDDVAADGAHLRLDGLILRVPEQAQPALRAQAGMRNLEGGRPERFVCFRSYWRDQRLLPLTDIVRRHTAQQADAHLRAISPHVADIVDHNRLPSERQLLRRTVTTTGCAAQETQCQRAV